jgi:hypothetical protein
VQVPLGCNPNGLDMIHGPKVKNSGAAPRHILDVQLFWWFPFIPDEFWHRTSYTKNTISLPFHRVQERPDWMSYATWASVLKWTTPRWVGLWILKFFWQFCLNLVLVGHGTSSSRKDISSSFHAYVERPNPISYGSCTSIWSRDGPRPRVGLQVKFKY